MTNESIKRIRTVFGILLSISIAVAGICLISACVGIYKTGDHPFSREVVAAAFSPIAFPVYLCLALVILGFVLDLVLPEDAQKRSPGRQRAMLLQRLRSTTDLDGCDESLRNEIAAQQKSRRLHRRITAALLAAGSVIFLIYALQEGAFHQSQINESMLRAMSVLLPCMAAPFGYGVFTAYQNAASMEKEISLLKQAGKKKSSDASHIAVRTDRTHQLRNVIAIIAVALLIFGFCTGGTADVLTKAVNICTECVGLG